MTDKAEKFLFNDLCEARDKLSKLPQDYCQQYIGNVPAIREKINTLINNRNIRMGITDAKTFFNCEKVGDSYLWNDTERHTFDSATAYYILSKQDIDSKYPNPSKYYGKLKQALDCYGIGDNSVQWLDDISRESGIGNTTSAHVPEQQTSVTATKTDISKTDVQKKRQERKQRNNQLPQQVQAEPSAEPVQSAPVKSVPDAVKVSPIRMTTSATPSTNEGDKPLLPLQSISVLDCVEIEPRRYLVDGLIEAGTITQYAGKEKSGKTYTLMHMALCMSAGMPWLGRDTMQDVHGSILWLNLDMSRSLGKRRVNEIANGIQESFDKRTPEMFRNFHMMDSQTFSEANREGLQFFTDNNAVEGLKEFIIENNIIVCFLDNLIQVEGNAQENVSNEMRTVLNRMKQVRDITGCSFVFIHHTDKAGNRGRGSSDIFAETDLNLQLEPDVRNSNLLKLVTDGSRSTASQDIGMLQEWKQRIDDDGQPMTDVNGHPVYIYRLSTEDVNKITTAKEERTVTTKTNKTISDNIEKIKDVFRTNGNRPLSKNAIIKSGDLKGTKDTQLMSIDKAMSSEYGVLKSDTGLLFQMNDGII